jgi:hypothetical protein
LSIFNVNSQVHVDTFYYTGSAQTFTISNCSSDIYFDIRGGRGGDQTSGYGGLGGRVEGSMSFNTGDILYLNVGQSGLDNQGISAGVFVNSGGVISYNSGGVSGTGGGSSDIRLNGTTIADRIFVGGGGGGAGGTSGQALNGGAGGDLVAGDGVNWNTFPNAGGKGGTQATGGTQGVGGGSCATYTTDGSLSFGGEGAGDGAGGGGGGGGYYGGGGACFSGGGGGSSYTDPAASSIAHTQGFQNGDGMIILTYNVSISTVSNQSINTCDSLVSPSGLYVWNTSGTYNDTIQNVEGCDSIMTIDLTVNTVDRTVTQVENILTASESGAIYQWVECPAMTAINGATNQSYTAISNGDYAVMITNNGCTSTSDCNTVSGVGIIENNFGSELLTYPNPTEGNFSIDLGAYYESVKVTMIDLSGKKIMTETYDNSQLINLNIDKPKGIYLLVIESKQKKAVIRLVKK